MTSLTAATPSTGLIADALAVIRYHIVMVAMAACLVFGWLITGKYHGWLTSVVALDWFLINLLNRVTDINEDLKNKIQGAERIARSPRLVTLGCAGLMLLSFAATHAIWPELTPWRVLVQLIGLAYNYKIVPTPKGLSRLKEIYFFKNFGSSILFFLTCFVYPIESTTSPLVMQTGGIIVLVAFFIPFELTYEILYDLRDLEGDRAELIPTYPVVHGPRRSRQIIDALLIGSSMMLGLGAITGYVGALEALMLMAPAIQLAYYRPRFRRGLTSRDCIVLTHMGTGLLLFYLVGTALWRYVGLPANLYL